MNPETQKPTPEEMGGIQEGLDKAAAEAEKEAEGKEILFEGGSEDKGIPMTAKEERGAIANLSEDSEREAAEQFDAITDKDISEKVDTLGEGGATDAEIQTGQALNEAFAEKAKIDEVREQAQDQAK